MSQSTMHQVRTTASDLLERLAERIGAYHGFDACQGELTLLKEVHRRFCRLYLFSLSPRATRPDLVVKVPVGRADIAYGEQQHLGGFADRPRLFPRANPAHKHRYEYDSLCRIQAHFSALSDPRFDFVRVYDLFTEEGAMVLQWIHQPSLRERLYRTHRFGGGRQARALERAFSNTGAWLREHHQLTPLSHAVTRNRSRDDWLVSIERFAAYLFDHAADTSRIRRIHSQLKKMADAYLPTEIQTGQVHGDFAPRNAFIDQTDRVSVFDTVGRFEAPIFEDLAKMLICTKASGPQMFSRGLLYDRNQLRRYETSFLEGYFDDQPIPLPIVRLFEAQLLLEQWAAVVYRHVNGRGIRRVAKGFRRAIWRPGFQEYLRDITSSDVTST